MMHRRRTFRAVLALAAATSLGACLFSSSDETNASAPPIQTGTGTGTAIGAGGGAGAGPVGGECAPTETCYGQGLDGSGANGAGGTGPAAGGAGGEVTEPFEIPPECQYLDPSEALLVYPPVPNSTSMASATLARELLEAGQAPTEVRPEEFLNYYRFDSLYPAPTGAPLAVYARAALQDNADASYDVQIAVRSAEPDDPRGPMAITFVLDNSGSMLGEAMARQLAVVEAVGQTLQVGDRVNLVTWDTADAVRLDGHTYTGPGDTTLEDAAAALQGDGGTDLHGGLVAGYALAEQHAQAQTDGLNRVILVSDGSTSLGVTEETLIGNLIADGQAAGISLVGVGAGPADGYGDQLMHRVIGMGEGAYVYVDSVEEASELFDRRFDEVMAVTARLVGVELLLPWYFEPPPDVASDLAPNTIVDRPETALLAPGDTALFHTVVSGCHPAAVALDLPIAITVRWQTPGSPGSVPEEIQTSITAMTVQDQAPLRKAQAIMAYAEALQTGTAIVLNGALATIQLINQDLQDADLSEIIGLLERHPAIAR